MLGNLTDRAVSQVNGKVIPSMSHNKAAIVSDFRRGQILDAARHAFVRHGLAGTTVSQIARGAKVAKGTVYLYFRSKDEILRALLDDAIGELYRETVPLLAEPASCEEKLGRFLDATLGFFDRHRDFLEQCHFELTPEMRTKTVHGTGEVFAAQIRAWRGVLQRSRRSREGAVAPGRAAAGIVSFAYGLGQQRMKGWVGGAREDTVAWGAALLLKGLRVS
jgi:AcrR family transcriptional regulator